MDRKRVIATLEGKFCPNSTDGGMSPSNHRIASDGFCTICDRGIRSLATLHGLPYGAPAVWGD